MPIVSGVIAYDSANTYTFPNAVPAARILSGVPVVLQNTVTGVGLVVLTDATGSFSFGTVPAGSYNLVEAWGTTGGVASPGNFSTATVIPAPTPQDPPITKAPSPPATATRLQSLTRNTIPITVAAVDVTGQNFVDAPIIETPIVLRQSTLIGGNIITAAQTGEWGTLPDGAQNQLIPATAPYPANVPSLTYFAAPNSVGGTGGAYNATNIAYSGNYNSSFWWSMSNHTTFDETSRMMVINAAGGGPATNERFFATTIPVSPNTYYIGFAWVASLMRASGFAIPQVGVKVSTTGGTLIFNSPTPQLTFSNPPQWVQIGGVFNTGNNSVVNVEYQSLASGTNGNDFTADDFSVYQLQINPFLNSTKIVDKPIAKVGDVLTYTIVLSNTGTITAESVQFQDTIPAGTSFASGTVTVNNTPQPSFNPNTGFTVGGVRSGSLATISFKVNVVSVPLSGLAINNSTSVYSYSPVVGGVTIPVSAISNQVQTNIINSTITKSVSNNYSDISSLISYTLVYKNNSFLTASNVILIDTIPNGATFVPGSLSANGALISGNPNPPGVSLPDVSPNSTLTIIYDVITPSSLAQSPVKNSGTIQSTFTDTLSNSYPMDVTSNITTTTLITATLSSSKIVNKSHANVGDILVYTIPITNTGNTTATNILFIDTIPNNTTLVPGSFFQDSTPIVGSPNPPGVTLKNISQGATSTIVFRVTINTIPNPNPIPNTAFITYSYTIDNTTTPVKTGNKSTSTNIVNTQVNNANLDNIVKGASKQFAKIGDIITYTITIPNRGNVTANNVTFIDTIPNGTSFVANSVILNGTGQNGLVVAPPSGLSVGSIAPNASITLSFNVLVNTIPTPNPIPNSGNVTYSYLLNPQTGTNVNGSNNTNIVSTTINSAVINSTKTVTPTNCVVGNTVFYRVVLTNSGNATANNVTFIDTIPNGTSFNANSLALNGTNQPGQSPAPPNGFVVGSIPPNGVATITFDVTVNTIPSTNPIPNSSYTNYNYILNPTTGETSSNTSLSNTVSTYVNPLSNPLKIVDKQYAKPGDLLTYTVQWENKLSVTATNVVFIDTIPNDTTFVANSMTLNGVTIPGATVNPPNGFDVGTIPSGVFTTITFKVLVTTIPTPNPIPNQATGRYSFISDPTLGTITTETAASNIVNTRVNYASIPSAIKQVSENYGDVGDILTYTISFTNTGNTTATNINLIDTIPNGTSFNINSVYVNNVNQQGAVVAPPTGLNVGSLGPNQVSTISFTVTVTTIPSPNPIPNKAFVGYNYIVDEVTSSTDNGATNTNTVNTTISNANMGIIGKSADKSVAKVGDIITYTITISNTGNTTANNVILNDTIPTDTTFQSSSVYINGIQTSTTPVGNILSLNLGNIAPNGVKSIVFKVQIDTIPNPNPIPNSAIAIYTYTVNPSIPDGQNGSNSTNIVNTQVNIANLGGIIKFVDKLYVTCGDIITYTISIPNSGNITANNVILSDTVPSGTVFVSNSILVNGAQSSATSPTSIQLGSISPGATATVSFSVQVQC